MLVAPFTAIDVAMSVDCYASRFNQVKPELLVLGDELNKVCL